MQHSSGESPGMRQRQQSDSELAQVMAYLETGSLSEEEKSAQELAMVLLCPHFEVLDGVLYHKEADKTLRVVQPETDRHKVFEEAHAKAQVHS